MSVVIDASALVAFVTNEPTARTVSELIQRWGSEGTEMNAPALARYEIANALTKQAALLATSASRRWTRHGTSSPRISLSPKTWKPSYGRSMARSPATQAHAATESI